MSNAEKILDVILTIVILMPVYGVWVTMCIFNLFKQHKHDRQQSHAGHHR